MGQTEVAVPTEYKEQHIDKYHFYVLYIHTMCWSSINIHRIGVYCFYHARVVVD